MLRSSKVLCILLLAVLCVSTQGEPFFCLLGCAHKNLVSAKCVNKCSGNGKCVNQTCACFPGFIGASCSLSEGRVNI